MGDLTHINQFIIARRNRMRGAVGVVLFPHAGAGASVFFQWVASLFDLEPALVQLPGRESRLYETLATDLRVMSREIARNLDDLGPAPLIFFGHSMGALLAFEVARACLQANRNAPKHLILSAAPAPHVEYPSQALHELPLDLLWERLDSFSETPAAKYADPELREHFSPIIRADLKMNFDYRVEQRAVAPVPIPVAMTLLCGTRDQLCDRTMVGAWDRHTSVRADLMELDGDHFFAYQQQDAVVELIRLVARSLSGARL